jgi:hypothetical protein
LNKQSKISTRAKVGAVVPVPLPVPLVNVTKT